MLLLPYKSNFITVADLGGGGVRGVRTNPLKFPDFLGGWGRGRGFEYKDTSSNRTQYDRCIVYLQ